MPITMAWPRPCLAKHVPTLARSSSEKSGTLTAPGTWPLAYSPGERTSTTSASRFCVAPTMAETSAASSAPPAASSSFTLCAKLSMISGVIAASSFAIVAKISAAGDAIALGRPRGSRWRRGSRPTFSRMRRRIMCTFRGCSFVQLSLQFFLYISRITEIHSVRNGIYMPFAFL